MNALHLRLPTGAARALLAAAALSSAAGCATTGGGKGERKEDVVWPLPPEKPRIKWVRSFSGEKDLGSGGFRSAVRIFVPASPHAVVAQPTGLALSPDEKFLYVACASGGKVLRVDWAGGKMEMFADSEGKRPTAPFGVASDAEGNVYVSDMAGNAVWVYSPQNKFLRKMSAPQLKKPTGIAVDRRRQVLYVVSGAEQGSDNHRVEVFSLAGQHLRTIGKRGANPGEFNFPANLAVANDGSLYVVDMLNFRVQVFDPDGALVGMFGELGTGATGVFDKAKSVGFDAFGNVYVVDSQQGTVQIFNPRFQPLMSFAGRANAPGYLLLPTAITISSKNRIWVADFAAGTVNEYELVNTTTDDSFLAPGGGGPSTPEPSSSERPDSVGQKTAS